MSLIRIKDATDPGTWGPALDEAVHAVGRGQLVVLPTDTVYGIGADAFDPRAVQALLDAKGRGRQMPPPVLIPDVRTLDGLATDVPDGVRALADAFWPGGLTVIVRAQPSLAWDLGETHGTVALRVPDHRVALALLRRTGPLAVSSANRTGRPAATTAQEAYRQLGAHVPVFLDGGEAPGGVASTIVDATGDVLRVVRLGAIDLAALAAVAPVMAPAPPPAADDAPATNDAPAADAARPDADPDAAGPGTEPQDGGPADTPEAPAR
ncbi:L-threonylcarbamoyladenylate synthase [Cellulomonas sp. NPDC057328]|uniref:L-threonylcarbamoyladenylate synthase n=1 Tax=Cellulomonas sp. NPDC057328 TaxID=3346101 RepID=UPI003644EA8C